MAAVCYRFHKTRVEFLLVRTRGGRWTFPKGAIESGLSPAQAAALEAFEEAGVHGRIEEASFARYTHRKGGGKGRSRELVVQAHLCRVTRLGAPKESHREPTWFAADKAKRRLQQDRATDCAAQLVRVLDLAVARIREVELGPDNQAWRQVCFESVPAQLDLGSSASALSGLLRNTPAQLRSLAGDPRNLLRIPQLTSGSNVREAPVEVVNITDAPRRRRRSQPSFVDKHKNGLH